MKRPALFAIGMLFGTAAFGQDPLECIDPDVLRGLLLANMGDTVYGTDRPEQLDAFRIPDRFRFIGSSERTFAVNAGSRTTVTAAFGTELGQDRARELAHSALLADGWSREESTMLRGTMVFSSSSLPVGENYCRDAGNSVNLRVDALNGRTYVIYGLASGQGNPCGIRPPGFVRQPQAGVDQPTIELPSDPVTGRPARLGGSGGGSSGTDVTARAEFRLDAPLAHVVDDMVRQLAEQGWTIDADWRGTTTGGAAWSKQAGGGARLQATLQVTRVDEAEYTAVFRMVSLQ